MTEINRLLQKLCDADIEFVIVGGFAAMLHGFGRQVFVIAIDDLIKAKEALGRHKDLLVAQELKAIADRTRQ